MPGLVFGPHHRLLFVGDSITDAGRREALHAPYGDGYVSLVRALLLARYPALDLAVVNRGVSGNTVRDLAARWRADVLAERPHWVVAMAGINEAWTAMTGEEAKAVPADAYEDIYRDLLAQARDEAGAGLVVLEPFVVAPEVVGDPQAAAGMTLDALRRVYPPLHQRVTAGPELEAAMVYLRAALEPYRAAAHRVARAVGAMVVETQAAFDEAIGGRPPVVWAADRVHPTRAGQAVIARAFLRAVGYGDV